MRPPENTSSSGSITRFLRWWGAELSGLVPAALIHALGWFQEIMLITPDGDDFMVAAGSAQIGALRLPGVAAILDERRAAGAECVLRLPAAQGLRREAHIAHAALARGFEAFRGEIERQTPFAPDQVYLGYRAETAIDPRGRVLTRFVVAPCAALDDMLRRLAGFGVTPDRVTLADAADPAHPGDTLRRLASVRRHPPKKLLMAALLLLLAALASPFLHTAVALSATQAEIARLRNTLAHQPQPAGGADAPAQLAYLAAQRGARPPAVALLDALTRAVPDSAYLAQFNLSGDELALQGVARPASGLIAPLEALPMVAEAGFKAPVLHDPASGQEQFQLRLKLRGTSTSP